MKKLINGRLFSLLFVCITGLVGIETAAKATVDVFLDYTIVYSPLQNDGYCYKELPMWAIIGIPPASLQSGTFAPTKVLKQGMSSPNTYVNINLVATTPPMEPMYKNDTYLPDGTVEYSMDINVSALAAANGSTLAGRTATVRSAKMALLAMARNLNRLTKSKYKLWVKFIGLPNQTGLPGTYLYATTKFAYTQTSPLRQAYEQELINSPANCE